MRLTTSPSAALRGQTFLPGDKSISHRAALFAALAQGESRVDNFLVAGVTQAMLDALIALGITCELKENQLKVNSPGLWNLRLKATSRPALRLDCGNSATTLRLLAGALSASGLPVILDGSPGLRTRPMGRIVEPLKEMGVKVESTQGKAPLTLQVSEFPLRAINYNLPVASAQVKSCLLLAALAADGQTTLVEPAQSRDHTERMLQSNGIQVLNQPLFDQRTPTGENPVMGYRTIIQPPPQPVLKPVHITIPGDFSSAAFLIVAGLTVSGSEVVLKNVGLNPTRTGLLDALRAMGADIEIENFSEHTGEPAGDLIVKYSRLHGTTVSGSLVVRMIDEFPAFAAAAVFAEGLTTVCQAQELRNKESDRISTLCQELGTLGVAVKEFQDGFQILGPQVVREGLVSSHGDHRLAMALTLLGLASQSPVTVEGIELISESFPGFLSTLQSLGAEFRTDYEAGSMD
jgi:3-phosphoshikimate 1-carboxyvinyltransferase